MSLLSENRWNFSLTFVCEWRRARRSPTSRYAHRIAEHLLMRGLCKWVRLDYRKLSSSSPQQTRSSAPGKRKLSDEDDEHELLSPKRSNIEDPTNMKESSRTPLVREKVRSCLYLTQSRAAQVDRRRHPRQYPERQGYLLARCVLIAYSSSAVLELMTIIQLDPSSDSFGIDNWPDIATHSLAHFHRQETWPQHQCQAVRFAPHVIILSQDEEQLSGLLRPTQAH